MSAASRPGIVAQNMGAGGRTIRSYAPARCDALGVGRRDDNMIVDLDLERSTTVGKPASSDAVVFARGRSADRVIVVDIVSGVAGQPRTRIDDCASHSSVRSGPHGNI